MNELVVITPEPTQEYVSLVSHIANPMTQRYDTYKESGVQWLGEIPGHWGCTALGRVLSEKLQYGASESGELEYSEDSMRYIRITDITIDGKLKNDGCKYLPSEIGKLYPVKRGDVLLARSGATVGKAFIYNDDSDACYAGYLIKASVQHDKVLSHYFYFFTLTSQYEEWKNRTFIQATIQNISAEKYARMHFPLPPLPEQRAIVTYLDDKCGKIDKVVEGKQKQIELLAEMKQRIIADAVTRGLNPNVKMKATNIPWLPEIPEHWEIKPIRAIVRENVEKSETGEEELLSLSQYTGVSRKKDALKTGMFEAESTVGYKIVHPGQLVMNIMLAWNGSYAVSGYEGIISPAYCVFDFITDCDKMYFHYLWRLSIYQGAFKTESRGIIDSRLRLYPNRFLPFPTICPSVEEQHSIVEYLDDKCGKIDLLVEKLKAEIEAIKEYKQRLISDVVTGQIKVC